VDRPVAAASAEGAPARWAGNVAKPASADYTAAGPTRLGGNGAHLPKALGALPTLNPCAAPWGGGVPLAACPLQGRFKLGLWEEEISMRRMGRTSACRCPPVGFFFHHGLLGGRSPRHLGLVAACLIVGVKSWRGPLSRCFGLCSYVCLPQALLKTRQRTPNNRPSVRRRCDSARGERGRCQWGCGSGGGWWLFQRLVMLWTRPIWALAQLLLLGGFNGVGGHSRMLPVIKVRDPHHPGRSGHYRARAPALISGSE